MGDDGLLNEWLSGLVYGIPSPGMSEAWSQTERGDHWWWASLWWGWRWPAVPRVGRAPRQRSPSRPAPPIRQGGILTLPGASTTRRASPAGTRSAWSSRTHPATRSAMGQSPSRRLSQEARRRGMLTVPPVQPDSSTATSEALCAKRSRKRSNSAGPGPSPHRGCLPSVTLLSRGLSVKAVADRLGHASPVIALRATPT
jgi:hypothetical protein